MSYIEHTTVTLLAAQCVRQNTRGLIFVQKGNFNTFIKKYT